ncbi:MAG: NAD-dependent epimerase/dehydratase family protein, partial [Candidatus Hydrogenedentes bacterium]|nr:NAD-dependent epimerase/dehydratase family protein [Candidatus Hydrogenedentota bacterium]
MNARAGALSVLVTGAGGYLGSETIKALAHDCERSVSIVAADVREIPADRRRDGVEYVIQDVCDEGLEAVLRAHRVDTVVHLASIVTPGKKSD